MKKLVGLFLVVSALFCCDVVPFSNFFKTDLKKVSAVSNAAAQSKKSNNQTLSIEEQDQQLEQWVKKGESQEARRARAKEARELRKLKASEPSVCTPELDMTECLAALAHDFVVTTYHENEDGILDTIDDYVQESSKSIADSIVDFAYGTKAKDKAQKKAVEDYIHDNKPQFTKDFWNIYGE